MAPNKPFRPPKKGSSGSRRNPTAFNKHINFKREGEKGNARKEPTEVTCVQCKTKFILPFKPRRPDVYCDACFKKKR